MISVDARSHRRRPSLSTSTSEQDLRPHRALSSSSTLTLRNSGNLSSPLSASYSYNNIHPTATPTYQHDASSASHSPLECPPLLYSKSPYHCIELPRLDDNVQLNRILLLSLALICWDIRTSPVNAGLIGFHHTRNSVDWRLTPATTPPTSSLTIRCARFDRPIVVFPSTPWLGISVYDVLSTIYRAEHCRVSAVLATQESVFAPGSALGRLDIDPFLSQAEQLADPTIGHEALRTRRTNDGPNHGRHLRATGVGGCQWAGLMRSAEEADVWILVLNEGRPSVFY
jgi:hypothetical protein